MTDLEAIAYWVNPGELFATAVQNNKSRFSEKDVYFIKKLGEPTGGNIDFFYRAFSATKARMVVSGVIDPCAWVKYFNRASSEFMELDDDSFIFEKQS